MKRVFLRPVELVLCHTSSCCRSHAKSPIYCRTQRRSRSRSISAGFHLLPTSSVFMETCAGEPVRVALGTHAALIFISFFLQSLFLAFTVYHLRSRPFGPSQKLCVASQIFGVSFALHQTVWQIFFTIFKFYDVPSILCQTLNASLGSLIAVTYYAILILFWMFRLQMAFRKSKWPLSNTFLRVRTPLFCFVLYCICPNPPHV